MKLRKLEIDNDFESMKNWVTDERTHAMWCYEKAGFVVRKLTPDAFAYKDETWGRCNMEEMKLTI